MRLRSPARLTLAVALVASALLTTLFPVNARWWDVLNRAWAEAPPLQLAVAVPDAPGGSAELAVRAALAARFAGVNAVGLLLPPGAQPDPVALAAAASPELALGLQPREASPGLGLQVASVTLGREPDAPALNVQGVQDHVPSLGWFLAERQVSAHGPPDEPRPLRALAPRAVQRLSLNALAEGRVPSSALRGHVLILDGSGQRVADERGSRIPLGLMQARAVATLSLAPLRPVPLLVSLVGALLLTALAWGARGYWGFVLAVITLALSAALFVQDWLFPGVTVSLGPVLGALAASTEGWVSWRRLRLTDQLTGLGNRAALLLALERLWQRGQRQSVTVLVLDLDDFSDFNGRFGRAAGDRMLREVATTLRREQRGTDVWFRWGADEFVLLIRDATAQVAPIVAERVQRAIHALHYQDRHLTASVGHASGIAGLGNAAELLDRASRAMQRRKYTAAQRG